MRANNEDQARNTRQFLRLEDEVEAWRKKRVLRPISTSGKVAVVRIRRRGPSASLSPASAHRPLVDAAR